MTAFDWAIVALPWVLIFAASLVTRRYVKGVADFLAAGRGAGRYLICVAEGAAGMGLITVIAMFEQYSRAGTAILWWGNLAIPVGVMLTLSGFVIYRFRETRALTLAQFFEVRYSRAFRVFAGLLAFVSGVVNYGIFPGVSARFFVYYLGLPETLLVAGFAVPTFAILMAFFLSLALAFVLLGGQLQILVTDCLAGALGGFLMLAVAGGMLSQVSFEQMFQAVSAVPDNQSLINPFKTSGVKDFNIWYALIGLMGLVYTQMAWQGNQGFNSSAANPHEAKMGRVLASWRGYAQGLMLTILALGAYAFLHHPDFAPRAAAVMSSLGRIDQPQVQEQMRVPLALSVLLPVGIKGAFAALMLLMMVNVDKSYLHSWGSIFIQDVVMPFRRTALSPETHLRLLRWAIAGVAVWGFCFSLVFRQTDYILMFFAVTGALYLGGAGSVIIGGLYWKRGTTGAAWTAMISGSVLAVSGLVLQNVWPDFPINGQVTFFLAMVVSIGSYVGVSLLTCRAPFDLDRMLHRVDGPPRLPNRNWVALLLGVDREFKGGDRIVSGSVFVWNGVMFAAFLIITASNLWRIWPDRWWWNYNLVNLGLTAGIASVTVVWFACGGLRDLFRLFRLLARTKNNPLDDGTVVAHQNAAERPVPQSPPVAAPASRPVG
jgi:SSS family solute:Na+ symporter